MESENINQEEEEGMMVEDEQSLLDDIDTESGLYLDFHSSADKSLIGSDQKAAKQPNLCDYVDTMEQEIFHGDDVSFFIFYSATTLA